VLIASGWLQLEDGPPTGSALGVVLLALAPALLRRPLLRLAGAVVAALLAIHTAVGVSPLEARPFDDRHDFFGPVLSRLQDGLTEFYDVKVPFAAAAHPRMHGLVLLAIFGFCLAVALAVAARRPLAAGLALLAGAVWPATLLTTTNEVGRGAVVLAAVLVLLAGLRPRARALPHAAVAGVVVTACALAASASPAVAKSAFLDWEHWNLAPKPERRVTVSYVWDASYDGIRFPKKMTTVLRIKAPSRALYWRATALDAFTGGTWREEPPDWIAAVPRNGRDELLDDALRGWRARRAPWVKQEVTVEALADHHLIGANVPMAYDVDDAITVSYAVGGIAQILGRLDRGDRYTVWSYAADPSPAQLRGLPPRYPRLVKMFGLPVERRIPVPAFGAPGRERTMRAIFAANSYNEEFRSYEAFYAKARQVVGTTRSPYQAVVALESWFRTAGGFRYDEQPPQSTVRPPLVDFVLKTKRGYCQHYAGAMALMLRYLGIPARVAVGFTSGTFDSEEGEWNVTDHNAHAWVEVWFPGFGWLPFDPTPRRGALGSSYTAASPTFNLQLALEVLKGTAGLSEDQLRARLARSGVGDIEQGLFGEESGGHTSRPRLQERGGNLLGFLVLLAAGLLTLVALVKAGRRRARYLSRDPRRIARACRQELVDFLLDQRLDVPRSATVAELGRLLETRLGVPAGHFVAAAGAARFGAPEQVDLAARRSRRELRMLLALIRRRLPPSARLRGLVSLRSLGFA
jgi:protein-glutamine gamma-glutamyltransferase